MSRDIAAEIALVERFILAAFGEAPCNLWVKPKVFGRTGGRTIVIESSDGACDSIYCNHCAAWIHLRDDGAWIDFTESCDGNMSYPQRFYDWAENPADPRAAGSVVVAAALRHLTTDRSAWT